MLIRTYASSRVKKRAFIEKVNSWCFCWFATAMLVDHQYGVSYTKLYKVAWNVSANNSETVGHKDLRLGQIVYILVFYNISFSWFPIYFFVAWQWKRSIFRLRLWSPCRRSFPFSLARVKIPPSPFNPCHLGYSQSEVIVDAKDAVQRELCGDFPPNRSGIYCCVTHCYGSKGIV